MIISACAASNSSRSGASWCCYFTACAGSIAGPAGWAIGKHQLTKAYMLFLAHWARKLSWQETAMAFRTSWEKVGQAVEYVVAWGLEHRHLGPIQAIGVASAFQARDSSCTSR